ncbi:inositol monophosphatase family protein [Magnetococcus sp. PR-3]|uniref:inositol monophosphatase family protein n=1 Tax=Magnetococcus sp. PR-3 TaxID=3120355 RepID=UPI002FCDED83
MDPYAKQHILKATQATEIESTQLIQKLWNDYGVLQRVYLKGGNVQSVILKHIRLPLEQSHPKGFNSAHAKQRKIKSYQVETSWYQDYNPINLQDNGSRTAHCLASFQKADEFFILLEDLDTTGYSRRLTHANWAAIQVVLAWLACFHAKFMGYQPNGLWNTGSYWHLKTRPDELQALEDPHLRNAAPLIDEKLNNTPYLTLIHGDAKLANFCFSEDAHQVAAVDFQYIGHGCGMKDVAYFIGSCLDEEAAEHLEEEILTYYFKVLSHHLQDSPIDTDDLQTQWRALYPFAWADFHRFLKGWSPDHWKINSYSEKTTQKVMESIQNELLTTATTAAVKAGKLIRNYWKKEFEVMKKAGSSRSAQIVTEVDVLSQEIILAELSPSMHSYGLGLLTEEEQDTGNRLTQPYFWSIDPLDGTLFFSEGKSGFAVSIALISQTGETQLGVVYDPVSETLYHAVRGQGCFKNHVRFHTTAHTAHTDDLHLFVDRSLKEAPNYTDLENSFTLHFTGGAVINTLQVLNHPNACYFKYPKEAVGGCAIWDLAAIALIVQEAGGIITGFAGQELTYNRAETLYFNQEGLMICSHPSMPDKLRSTL